MIRVLGSTLGSGKNLFLKEIIFQLWDRLISIMKECDGAIMISFSPMASITYFLPTVPFSLYYNPHSWTPHRSYCRIASAGKFYLDFQQHLQDSISELSSCSFFPHLLYRKFVDLLLVLFLSWWMILADNQASLWVPENQACDNFFYALHLSQCVCLGGY